MEIGGKKFLGKGGHLGGAALGAAAAGVAEIATERAMAFYRNRKLKRKIMRNKDAALGLLELTQQGEEEGENEIFSTIITKKNEFRKQLPRVAQKVVHYISKAHKTDEKAKEILKTIQTWQKEKKHSPFRSCEEAWDYNRAISYAFKNYNKFVTHMVYMEALLLQLDLKVSDRTNISQGKIVSEGKQWPKPPHMRARQKDEEVEDEIEYTDNPLFRNDA